MIIESTVKLVVLLAYLNFCIAFEAVDIFVSKIVVGESYIDRLIAETLQLEPQITSIISRSVSTSTS